MMQTCHKSDCGKCVYNFFVLQDYLAQFEFILFNHFLANGDFCWLLITLANTLDPNQDGQNIGPDLDPNG